MAPKKAVKANRTSKQRAIDFADSLPYYSNDDLVVPTKPSRSAFLPGAKFHGVVQPSHVNSSFDLVKYHRRRGDWVARQLISNPNVWQPINVNVDGLGQHTVGVKFDDVARHFYVIDNNGADGLLPRSGSDYTGTHWGQILRECVDALKPDRVFVAKRNASVTDRACELTGPEWRKGYCSSYFAIAMFDIERGQSTFEFVDITDFL